MKKNFIIAIATLSIIELAACSSTTSGTSQPSPTATNAPSYNAVLDSKITLTTSQQSDSDNTSGDVAAQASESTVDEGTPLETVTINVSDLDIPDNFNEDFLLPNTYNEDNELKLNNNLSDNAGEYSSNTLIVQINNDATPEQKAELAKKYDAEIIYDYNIISAISIKLSRNMTKTELDDIIEKISKEDIVIGVEKDYIAYLNTGVAPVHDEIK